MIRLLFVLAIVHLACNTAFKRYTDYREYLAQWKAMVPEKYIHDVSHLAGDGEFCYDSKCQFFYYESPDEPEEKQIDKMTVLLVSGMHGDEFIGPHTLLYAYPHLRAHKIIYLPMANPSGFIKGTRQTFPGKVDLNRDFPIDGNTLCYQATATRILDLLFRTYHFDLTVALHNGGNGAQIGFNWGTFAHQAQDHTAEYDIYNDIGEMLRREGGMSADLGLPEFKMGTMKEVIYPAVGTFDDWAYAAGKFPEFITKCSNYAYEPYPKDMANGLVFLFELGPKSKTHLGSQEGLLLPPDSSNKNNGFAARAIRMLRSLMNVLHPKLNFIHQQDNLKLLVSGCKTATVSRMLIKKEVNASQQSVYEFTTPIIVQGDLRNKAPVETKIELNSIVMEGDSMIYQGSFECDPEWVGKGTTVFSKPRTFNFTIKQPAQKATVHQIQQQLSLKQKIISNFDSLSLSIDLKEYTYQLAGLALLILGTLTYSICRRCCKKKKVEKFQEVEFQGESEQNTAENEQDAGGDLHTARGGILNM